MLRIENIAKAFNPGTITEKVARTGLSLHLAPGEFVTVIGGNGAGKSTLMNSIAGTFFVDRGKIFIDGEDIKIALNASYLIDVLKILNGENIVISLNGTLKPAAVRDPEKEDFIYIITPVQTRT